MLNTIFECQPNPLLVNDGQSRSKIQFCPYPLNWNVIRIEQSSNAMITCTILKKHILKCFVFLSNLDQDCLKSYNYENQWKTRINSNRFARYLPSNDRSFKTGLAFSVLLAKRGLLSWEIMYPSLSESLVSLVIDFVFMLPNLNHLAQDYSLILVKSQTRLKRSRLYRIDSWF